jgi:vacuolar-type H+-ATPase subunit H
MTATRTTPRVQTIRNGAGSTGGSPDLPRATDGAQVDAAIARVLQAEQQARERVAACTREASQTVQAAREQARRIAARGARRSARVNAYVNATVQSELARIETERAGLDRDADATSADAGRVQAAIEGLADELTGAAS